MRMAMNGYRSLYFLDKNCKFLLITVDDSNKFALLNSRKNIK